MMLEWFKRGKHVESSWCRAHHKDVPDTAALYHGQRVGDERPIANGQQRFGHPVLIQGVQPAACVTGQNHSLRSHPPHRHTAPDGKFAAAAAAAAATPGQFQDRPVIDPVDGSPSCSPKRKTVASRDQQSVDGALSSDDTIPG